MKINRQKAVDVVYELAKPIADELGFTIWDIRFEKEGSMWVLSVVIDKEGGITIDDCEAMSRSLDVKLDEVDPIEQSYGLEVSSAGIERELTQDWHFAYCHGETVVIRLIRPYNGEREYRGTLTGFLDGAITIRTEDGEDLTFLQGDTAYVRLWADLF